MNALMIPMLRLIMGVGAVNVMSIVPCSTAAMPPISEGLRARDVTITAIRNHTAAEHPSSLFVRVWKEGPAVELAKGLRFALDVEVDAVPGWIPISRPTSEQWPKRGCVCE